MTLSKLAIFVAAAALAAVSAVAVAKPSAAEWEIGPWVKGRNYSVGMPAHPERAEDGTLRMQFPLAGRGQVDAWTTATGPLDRAQRITLRYRIDAAPGTRFVAEEAPHEPAAVSLYFQRAGDNWSAKGLYASFRWYVPVRAVMPLAPGEHTVTVGFDERWSNVRGQFNTADPRGFEAALAGAARIGIAFGSRSLRSHGVHATGPATFTLLALEVE